MSIKYKINAPITVQQFIDLLDKTSLGERRPTHDLKCMQGMLDNANLIVSAWDNDELVGIARNVTDFYYACYLSDLAVSETHQKQGIGKQLQILTQEQLGEYCKLILLAAPKAGRYYEHIGFDHNERCWVLPRNKHIKSN